MAGTLKTLYSQKTPAFMWGGGLCDDDDDDDDDICFKHDVFL